MMNQVTNDFSVGAADDCIQYTAQLYSLAKDVNTLKKELDNALLRIAQTEYEVLMKLSLVAEYKDTDTSVHIHRIGYMAELLSKLLNHPPEFCFLMRLAAPMHDVGKLGIPDSVLQKPGQYTAEERQVMNQHPVIGAKILDISNNTLFQLASSIALSHHEKYDGSGYPYGLSGKDIPLEGRIVSLVDFFDALTMDRCYRKAFSDDDALSMLADLSGIQFDPEMVNVFMQNKHLFIELREKVNASNCNYNNLISLDIASTLGSLK